ncbi:transposable element Tc1 transposase [Trichonephila clavipes]|nr:transposable element Tc1 transposase [Trichonephila clavipes]
MDDNAWPHRTLAVELLESDITQLDCPAYSPDLIPSNMCGMLSETYCSTLTSSREHQQLKQMLIEEWALLPQEMLHQLVLSIRRRCEGAIAGEEAYTILEHLLVLLLIDHHKSRYYTFNKACFCLDSIQYSLYFFFSAGAFVILYVHNTLPHF